MDAELAGSECKTEEEHQNVEFGDSSVCCKAYAWLIIIISKYVIQNKYIKGPPHRDGNLWKNKSYLFLFVNIHDMFSKSSHNRNEKETFCGKFAFSYFNQIQIIMIWRDVWEMASFLLTKIQFF